MPLRFKIDHARRFVDVEGRGVVGLQDILDYLDALVTDNGMPYRKLLDLRDATPNLTDGDVMVLGARVSVYANLEPRGPVALVSNNDESDLFIRRFMNLGGAKRPIKLFQSMDKARDWLLATPEA
ncbi:MAG: hypothetical protein JSR47_24620 [Proteobacteria bacterium]|nr:hypothetical protein [Pseudomonadota bacterium]